MNLQKHEQKQHERVYWSRRMGERAKGGEELQKL